MQAPDHIPHGCVKAIKPHRPVAPTAADDGIQCLLVSRQRLDLVAQRLVERTDETRNLGRAGVMQER